MQKSEGGAQRKKKVTAFIPKSNLRLLAREKLVCLLILGHSLGNDILGECDAGALVETNRVEVVAKVLLVEA